MTFASVDLAGTLYGTTYMLDLFGVFPSASDVDWDITRTACWFPACVLTVSGDSRETAIGELCAASDDGSGRR